MIVHLVTDRRSLAAPGSSKRDTARCLRTQVQFAVDAGVDVVQIRERDLDARELSDLVRDVVALTRGTATRVVMNDRVDVALACGADGVHLRADSIPPHAVRRLAPPVFLIGRSVHSAAEARDEAEGADYLIAGTVWSTSSKPAAHRLLGVDGLRAIVAATRVPVLAIGGVTLARAGEVAVTGAAGVAAIGLFQGVGGAGCRAVPVRTSVDMLRRTFDTLRSAS